MGSLLYVTHPLRVAHYCGVVTTVGLRGGLGGLLGFQNELIDSAECGEFCRWRGAGARPICHLSTRHRAYPADPSAARSMYSSSDRRLRRTARPTCALLISPDFTSRQSVVCPSPTRRRASSYVSHVGSIVVCTRRPFAERY